MTAGCVDLGSSGGSSGDGAEQTIDPTRAAENDLRLRELACRDSKGEDFPDVMDVDLRNYTWTMPNGFASSSSYIQEDPVEGEYEGQFMIPIKPVASLNVIGIVMYPQLKLGPLVDKCARLDSQAALARLQTYHDILGASVVEAPQKVTIGGLPGFREVLEVNPRDYTWTSYWVFGRNQLLHVSCQWTDQKEIIAQGCDELMASFKFTG